jgi:hypothetical protein
VGFLTAFPLTRRLQTWTLDLTAIGTGKHICYYKYHLIQNSNRIVFLPTECNNFILHGSHTERRYCTQLRNLWTLLRNTMLPLSLVIGFFFVRFVAFAAFIFRKLFPHYRPCQQSAETNEARSALWVCWYRAQGKIEISCGTRGQLVYLNISGNWSNNNLAEIILLLARKKHASFGTPWCNVGVGMNRCIEIQEKDGEMTVNLLIWKSSFTDAA